jgi:hypothetical protein
MPRLRPSSPQLRRPAANHFCPLDSSRQPLNQNIRPHLPGVFLATARVRPAVSAGPSDLAPRPRSTLSEINAGLVDGAVRGQPDPSLFFLL